MPTFSALKIIYNDLKIAGSLVGTFDDTREMLDLAVEKQIKPWIQTMSMEDANQAIIDLEEGKPRYRIVLVNEKQL